jgi:hypothetical protein
MHTTLAQSVLRCLVLATMILPAGCGVFSGSAAPTADADDCACSTCCGEEAPGTLPPAPLGESQPTTQFVAQPTARLAGQPSPLVIAARNELAAGRYVGTIELDRVRSELRGAGAENTVIDGNLLVGSHCTVRDVTVTGDVLFTGNGARLFGVRCLGQVLDYGQQNRR